MQLALDDPAALRKIIAEQGPKTSNLGNTFERLTGALHCPKCGDVRRMSIELLYYPAHPSGWQWSDIVEHYKKTPTPCIWRYQCLQCFGTFTAILYSGVNGPELAIFSPSYGGISTPNTPAPIAYYLDQAHRCHSVSANSAAVAMYRAALEQLFEHEGYRTGMLGSRIKKLEEDLAAGKAPRWAGDIDREFLALIKELGDGAIHPNSGDISKQNALDADLVRKVAAAISMLLEEVFERPARTQAMKARIQEAAAVVKKPRA
jgi:hypothetical protein